MGTGAGESEGGRTDAYSGVAYCPKRPHCSLENSLPGGMGERPQLGHKLTEAGCKGISSEAKVFEDFLHIPPPADG